MKPRHFYGVLIVWCVVFFALVPRSRAQQAAAPIHIGVPQDWSQHQIVFSRDALAQRPDLLDREPRVLHQVMQRWQLPEFGVFRGVEPRAATKPISISPNKTGMHRDWNVTLPGRLGPNMFPAKYSFDPAAAPDCNNDYVVFGLGDIGITGGRPNLVAYNNLYSDPVGGTGLCDPANGGPGLSVLFAYNITTVTGGRISTSPILSLDGTKIAFVESVPGATPQAIFHVLTWSPGGTLIAPQDPAPGSMISLPISASANDTTSSPWIDYSNDIVYVGTDDGNLYQITGVFNGTPVLTGGNWPITVAASNHLTPPVLDVFLGLLMVGAGNGNLYQIDTVAGVVNTLLQVGASGNTTPGILAPPMVDVSNGTTFAVSANDGTSAVLVQVDTFSMKVKAKARIGIGAATPTPPNPAVHIYQPAFSNDYFNDPSTGVVTICGTGAADTSPYQYVFGFTEGVMNTASVTGFPQQLLTSTVARCSGWTEFFNPNVGTAGTDFLFFGLTQDCTTPGGGAAAGCLIALSSDSSIPTAKTTLTRGPSGIVVDNYSSAAQAASIYTMAEGANVAYKFTQNGLQ